ncbi:MAG: hypothetical protein Q9202_003874 [Teloschistes flavicans]
MSVLGRKKVHDDQPLTSYTAHIFPLREVGHKIVGFLAEEESTAEESLLRERRNSGAKDEVALVDEALGSVERVVLDAFQESLPRKSLNQAFVPSQKHRRSGHQEEQWRERTGKAIVVDAFKMNRKSMNQALFLLYHISDDNPGEMFGGG